MPETLWTALPDRDVPPETGGESPEVVGRDGAMERSLERGRRASQQRRWRWLSTIMEDGLTARGRAGAAGKMRFQDKVRPGLEPCKLLVGLPCQCRREPLNQRLASRGGPAAGRT